MLNAIIEPLERHWPAALLVLVGCLVPLWIGQITNEPINSDGRTNARMAVNLVHHGVISRDEDVATAPTMYREPLPAVSAALGVLIADGILGRASTPEYLRGERGRYLKFHHVPWKAAAVVGTYALILLLSSSHIAALIGAALIGTRPDLDTLNTELEAGALLVIGLELRLVALTKAAFLYVFIGFVAIVPFVFESRNVRSAGFALPAAGYGARLRGVGRSLPTVAILVAAFAAVTLPWMVRNYMHFGAFEISGRAGIVLYTRAMKNQMTAEEYWGSFYAWSPRRVRGIVGRLMGFDESDLALGGPLQRFNRAEDSELAPLDEAAELSGRPEAALTFYRAARAERVRLVEQYSTTLPPEAAERAADDELKTRALRAFAAAPLKHLAMSIPFTWRGAGLFVPVLAAAFVLAWRRSDRAMLLVALTASGYIVLHALLTHFEGRFAAPLKPLILAVGVVVAAEVGKALLVRSGAARLVRQAQV
jgi:hypothetical protein